MTALHHARWLVSRMGRGVCQKALNILAVGFVSVCIPWVIGTRFLSAFILIPLACLSVFMVADLIVDSFKTSAGDDDEAPSKAIACVLIGWSFGLMILVLGMIGLNLQIRYGRLLLPSVEILADALGLSLAACVLTAGVTLHVVRRAKPGTARLILKITIVLVTVLLIYGCNRWQIEGTFLLTTRTISWITGFAATGMFAIGAGLIALPRGVGKE